VRHVGDTCTWRKVAIKKRRPHALENLNMASYEELEDQCLEIKALSHLRRGSPAMTVVLHMYEFYKSGNDIYLVTELLGQDLGAWRSQHDAFTERMAADVCRSILQSLEFCRSRGVVHRNVQLQTVRFGVYGDLRTLKLTDFSLARVLGQNESVSDFCGPLGSIAPEIYAGTSYRFEVDMFAFGVLLFKLLSGDEPFPSNDTKMLRIRTAQLRYDVRRETWDSVSALAKAVIRKLLINQHERLTVNQALLHPFFSERAMKEATTSETAYVDADSAGTQTSTNFPHFAEIVHQQNKRIEEVIVRLNQTSHVRFTDAQREILILVIGDKCKTQKEEDEKNAILASKHSEFYFLLARKLYCMINAFEVLSSGAISGGNGESMRSFTARLLHEKGIDFVKGTKIGVIVSDFVGWVTRNAAVIPFLDTMGSICQLLLTLKTERDRYMGVARVADFATMVSCQQSKGDGLRCTVERFARLMVRARCGMPRKPFVESRDEFGGFKKFVVRMLGESVNTPTKEQAC
jgi:serine/threonine protein kinase